MSLADVAALAGVQRPVVTVWRSRASGSSTPFPRPVATAGGEERFDLDEVVQWLEATGRGNNRDVRGDAAAFALPTGMAPGEEQLVFAGLTALLCLKVVTGDALADLNPHAIRALAEDADPRDELLLREVIALGEQVTALARYADQVSDAAYSPDRAFEKLMAGRLRPAVAAHTPVELAPAAHDLVTALAAALAREAGADPAIYVDPTSGGSDLLVSLLTGSEADTGPSAMTLADDTPASRLARRRLRVHGVVREDIPVDQGGGFAMSGPMVHLAAYPSPGRPDMDAQEILTAIDDIQLQMDDQQRAVVVAPAGLLTDRLPDRRLDELRDHVLRLGRVRAIVRLPKGLVRARPRQPLALWVLGPDYAHVRLEDRWTSVADLTDTALAAGTTSDLVSDLVAAMGDQSMVRAHAFRFARIVPTVSLLAGRRALVGPRVTEPAPPSTPAAALALRVDELRAALAATQPSAPMAGTEVTVSDSDPIDARMTLGDAAARGVVRVVPGNRIDGARLTGGPGGGSPGSRGGVDGYRGGRDGADGGGIRVLGLEEVNGARPLGERRVDRLIFAASYDAGRLTEPGDVVFCTSPRPAALIDADGGSAVAYPARVLRVADPPRSGLLPAILADDINALDPAARSWRLWPVHRVPPEQAEPLAATLAQLQHEVDAATTRLDHLHELTALLVQGVSSRSLALTSPTGAAPPDARLTSARPTSTTATQGA